MLYLPVPQTEWALVLPILMVVLSGIFGLVVEMVHPKRDNNLIVTASIIGLLMSAFLLAVQFGAPPIRSFGDMVLRDPLALSMQFIIVIGTALVILFSEAYLREKKIPFGEFYPLILWSATGAMLMVSTTNLLLIFVGLEILSISLYVLAGLCRTEERSEESAMKYFLLGAFASGFLLYGIAFVYGATGSLQLEGIATALQIGNPTGRTLLMFGLAMLLIGHGFKASFVPFHQWTPDVYEGAPTNVTAYMATVAKVAAFTALFRLLGASTGLKEFWVPVLGIIAVLTMLGGNLMALRQTDIKRILAYSSISHAGYVLVAIMAHGIAPDKVGPNAIIYYMASYTLMTVGSFAIVSLGARNGKESTSLHDLHGMWQRSPAVAFCLIVFIASLIGLPPTSGFWGKTLIFSDALTAGLTPLAVVLAVASIISVYYYVNIAYHAFVPDGTEADTARMRPGSLALRSACIICAVGVIGTVIFFTPFINAFGAK